MMLTHKELRQVKAVKTSMKSKWTSMKIRHQRNEEDFLKLAPFIKQLKHCLS